MFRTFFNQFSSKIVMASKNLLLEYLYNHYLWGGCSQEDQAGLEEPGARSQVEKGQEHRAPGSPTEELIE